MAKTFWWREFDVTHLLPEGWRNQILETASLHARSHTIIPKSVTSREHDTELRLPVLTVGGEAVKKLLPWLCDLYAGEFLRIGQQCVQEEVRIASQWRYAINLNVQKGSMRYECHVDSNPLEGLLYVTDHPPGTGGELIVSRRSNVSGPEEAMQDAETIFPRSGHLVFFDAREHPHFVRMLSDPSLVRVAVAMNYYTPSCPESSRPQDLDRHLGLVSGH